MSSLIPLQIEGRPAFAGQPSIRLPHPVVANQVDPLLHSVDRPNKLQHTCGTVSCQELLVQVHPLSELICTRKDLVDFGADSRLINPDTVVHHDLPYPRHGVVAGNKGRT